MRRDMMIIENQDRVRVDGEKEEREVQAVVVDGGVGASFLEIH